MANLNNIPKQSLFQTTLTSPIDAVQTSGIILADNFQFTFSGEKVYLSILDPNNPEIISVTGQNVGGELTGVVRGLALAEGGASSASSHGAGVKVILSNPYDIYKEIQTVVNSKLDVDGGTITDLIDFSGDGRIQLPVYADDTARDAAIPSPVNGLIIYNTAEGEFQAYQSGSWVNISSGSTQPNATETVAGKVELATIAEAEAGTDIGGTGATNVVRPSQLAQLIQNSKYVYNATTGSGSAYLLDLTPALTAYTEGQTIVFKANHTNTGPTTININGLGVGDVKRNRNQALVAGNIQQDDIYICAYNGTYWELLNPNEVLPEGQFLVGDSNNNPAPFVLKAGKLIGVHAGLQTMPGGNNTVLVLATYTIPAKELTDRILEIKVDISCAQNSSNISNFRVKLNGNTIHRVTNSGSGSGDSYTNPILYIIDNGSNNQSVLALTHSAFVSGRGGSPMSITNSVLTENTNNVITLTLEFQNGNQLGTAPYTYYSSVIKLF